MNATDTCPGCGAAWPDFQAHKIEETFVCEGCYKALQRTSLRLLDRVKPQLTEMRVRVKKERDEYERAARAFSEKYDKSRRELEAEFAAILLREVP